MARRFPLPPISHIAKATDGEQPDNDLRQLEFKKNQYGPIGETIVLRYQRGLFLPEPPWERSTSSPRNKRR